MTVYIAQNIDDTGDVFKRIDKENPIFISSTLYFLSAITSSRKREDIVLFSCKTKVLFEIK